MTDRAVEEREHSGWKGANLRSLSGADVKELVGFASVVLQSNGLRTLPLEMRLLSDQLTRLDLTQNRLERIPDSIFSLVNLASLNLRANLLESLPAEQLQTSLLHLKELDVSENDLHSLSLRGVAQLRVLLAPSNRIQGGVVIADMPLLEILDLRSNKLSQFPELVNVPSLTDLSLRSNRLTTLPEDWSALSSLAKIDVGNNDISGVPKLRGAPSLAEVDFCYNRLSAVPEFDSVAALTRLSVSNNAISALPEALSGAHALKVLEANYNKLTEIPPAVVSLLLHSLEDLSLSYNAVMTLPPLPVSDAAFCLRRLDIRGNYITCEEAAHLLEMEVRGALNLCNFYETVPQKLIDKGMYLGSAESAKNWQVLQKLGITHIVNAAEIKYDGLYPKLFSYLTLGMRDDMEQDILAQLDQAVSYMTQAFDSGGGVLVHCAAGVSRSTSIALAYMISKEGRTLRDSFLHVKALRTHVEPNPGFVRQLVAYETKVHGQPSIALPPNGDVLPFLDDLSK